MNFSVTRIIVHPIARLFILLSVLGGLIFVISDTTGIKERISNLVFEAYIEIKPREASDKLVFVDIDDMSLSKVGQWPWPRTQLAQMVNNLKASGAAVIVFDGVLAEPDRTSPEAIASMIDAEHPAQEALLALPDNDHVLAQAIKDAGNFVAGFSHGSNPNPPLMKGRVLAKKDVKQFFLAQKKSGSLFFRNNAQFLPELQKAAAGNGSFMASLDNDAVIRQTGLIFHNGTALYPSLILEALRVFEIENKGYVKLSWNEALKSHPLQAPFLANLGDHNIPVSHDGKMWVYYRHFTKGEQISAHRFLDEDFNASPIDLSGKVVFIASEAEGLKDLRATPIGNMAGVKIHMNAFEQILQGNYLNRPTKAMDYEFFTAIGIALALILLSFAVNPAWLLLIASVFSIGSFAVSWVMFSTYGFLIDPVTPVAMVVVIFTIASVLSFLKNEIDRRLVRDAFGLYISPDFMKELTDNPDKLKLGGEIRDLTIMFTDIRRFTSICEGLGPEEIIQLINDFLTPMSDLVMQNRGTIDKYMGDAMMAFWNAPLDDPDHAHNACLAALGMQEALAPINERVAARAKEIGKEPVLLQAGIGINTGESAVGNMGSKQRFAYSTLSDSVNLASRLEGQTKTYGVGILIGEDTYLEAPDLAALEVDLILVQGKKIPVKIYVLLGDQEMTRSDAFSDQKEQHDAMIAQYRDGDFKAALKTAKACAKMDQFNLGVTYDLYQERCETLIKTPPIGEWDGIYVATSK